MDNTLRRLDISLVCEICEGEVDLTDDDEATRQCRHCGIAFTVDLPAHAELRQA